MHTYRHTDIARSEKRSSSGSFLGHPVGIPTQTVTHILKLTAVLKNTQDEAVEITKDFLISSAKNDMRFILALGSSPED